MARHRGPVLLDSNAILESYRVGCWRALSGGYAVETVEDCIMETQTGFQRRSRETQIDEAELRASLAVVHPVTDAERAVVTLSASDIVLDVGERSLWAHALTRRDGWVLCGPDKASLRFGVRMGFRDRLVALEALLVDAGHNAAGLGEGYTSKWLARTLNEMFLSEAGKRT